MTSHSTNHSAGGRPFRDGLFTLGEKAALLGSECRSCSARQFPARDFCPSCNGDDVETDVALARSGSVYSFTVVHQAPPGRQTPYTLAYVDLEDGVRVMAQIDSGGRPIEVGDPVTLEFRPQGDSDVYGYVFVPELMRNKEAAE
ncbi:Zn-ribbon domain-containing OB-fold protein [Sinorhizobium medicae]|uniref:DNA-binding protein n=1 Tax=Sinorhizobium medicae TaxID=110321 RepID=A0A508XB10_9HYPH|nr:Zn-ribbon domain-containing OB-fold protein [Sinorhizobium medicae]VTZ65463.1 conserved hypothetical protein [Sinorhizobium medicae]